MSAVDEFQRLAKLLGKWVLIAVAILVAFTVIITASLGGHSWLTYGRHAARVTATVKIDPTKKCTAANPLMIEIFNGSTKTVEHTIIDLSAKRPGRSTDIGDITDSNDFVILPGRTLAACTVPNVLGAEPGEDLRRFEWGIRSLSVRFAD